MTILSKGKPRTVEKDLERAKGVAEGKDAPAKEFIAEFSDWVLYKIKELIKSYCHHSPGSVLCGLVVLQKKIQTTSADRRESCDECMDSYIWIFEHLKKKLPSYKGRNGCTLSTYVWTILNSKNMYIDWLRWKYGRSDSQEARLPSCIKDLGQMEKEVYVALRRRKTVDAMATELNISLEETETLFAKVKNILSRAGLADQVTNPVKVSLYRESPDGEEMEVPFSAPETDHTDNIALNDFLKVLKDAFLEMPPRGLQLLSFKYKKGLTASEILDFCQKAGLELFEGKQSAEMLTQDVLGEINNSVNVLAKKVNEKLDKREDLKIDAKGLKYVLEEICF